MSIDLLEHFSTLNDPRQAWKALYPMPEIVLAVLCATMAGADDFVEISLWAIDQAIKYIHLAEA